MRLTQADHDVLQSESAYPLTQAAQIFRLNIFRDDATAGADDRGEPHDVIAATRADVRDGHTGFDAKQTHELDRFTGGVALFFVVPDWADDISDRTTEFGKAAAGAPGSAVKSWAEPAPDIANTVAKTAAIALQHRIIAHR